VLVMPFALYALADGALGVGMAVGESARRWYLWVLVLWGLSGAGVGIMTLLSPPYSRPQFMEYIALWVVTAGVLEVVTAVLMWRKLGGEWLLGLAGLISVAFGVSIMALSDRGPFVLSRLIAAHAFTFGVLLGIFALRARTSSVPPV